MNEELIERFKQFNVDVKGQIDLLEKVVVDFLSRWKGPIPRIDWSTWIDDKEVSFELEWYQDRHAFLSLHFYSAGDIFYITTNPADKSDFVTKKNPSDEEILEIVKDYQLSDGHMSKFWR